MDRTVLIADGAPELCAIYRTFLTGRGYSVETATDGLDCMEKVRRLRPAVVVLDPELHLGGGAGVLAWLREEGPILTECADVSWRLVRRGQTGAEVWFLGRRFVMRMLVAVLTGVLSIDAGLYLAGAAQAQNRQREGEGVAGRVQERIQDLNLTDTQEKQIADIRKDYRPKVEAVAKELGTIVKEEVEKVQGVLTPEQKTKEWPCG
jgi:DNA-binding response OmpR family regulator